MELAESVVHVAFVEPVNQALVFLISALLGAMKFPFHASQKNIR